MKITLALDEGVERPAEGAGFYYREGDGAIFVELYDDGRLTQQIELKAGEGVQGDVRFESFRITNRHIAGQTIDIVVGPYGFIDNRNLGDVSIRAASSYSPEPFKTVGLSVVEIVAADDETREVMLRADINNTGIIYIASALGEGMPLFAGDFLALTSRDSLSAIADTASQKLYIAKGRS